MSSSLRSELVSPIYFMEQIPSKINKEKYENFIKKIKLEQYEKVSNLLDICGKSKSALIDYLLFLIQKKKEYYINSGRILIYIKPNNYEEIKEYFSLQDWCQKTYIKSMQDWPSHIYSFTHNVFSKMNDENKDQCISIIGKKNSGKSFNVNKIIQYLFFLTTKDESNKESYNIVSNSIKIMELIGRIFKDDNIKCNVSGFTYHIGFKSNEIVKFDIDSEILDLTLPFSEDGRTFMLLHGFILTHQEKLDLENVRLNFFKKYYKNYYDNKDNEDLLLYYNENDIQQFNEFIELCFKIMNENELISVLNILYIIILLNEVTILKSKGKVHYESVDEYYINDDIIITKICTLMGIDKNKFLDIFVSKNKNRTLSLHQHKCILISLMKYSYYCLHDFILKKVKIYIKNYFNNIQQKKIEDQDEDEKQNEIRYIHIIDFPGEIKDQSLGGLSINYSNECLNLFSMSNYTSMISCLEKNNIRLKKFQSPLPYELMKSLIDDNGLLTFIQSYNIYDNIEKVNKLIKLNDNMPNLIEFLNNKRVVRVNYSYLTSFYSYYDLQMESSTLNIDEKVLKKLKKCKNKVFSIIKIEKTKKQFSLSDIINHKLKYLFFGLEKLEPFILYCINSEDIYLNQNDYTQIFGNQKNIIINTINWELYGYEEWINYNDFVGNIGKDYEKIIRFYSGNTLEQNGLKNNYEISLNLIQTFSLENVSLLGKSFMIMKKGTYQLIKDILHKLKESLEDTKLEIRSEKLKKLPLSKKLIGDLIKIHNKLKRINKKKRALQPMIIDLNDEIEGCSNNIISINIISKNIKIENDSKNNKYNIFTLLNNEDLVEDNKNNIIIPATQEKYEEIRKVFLSYKNLNNKAFDIKLINPFIIRIQSIYRGYFIRKKLYFIIKFVRINVILIQSFFRGFKIRKKFLKFLTCLKKIIFIQLLYKERYQKLNKAAFILQKAFREFKDKYLEYLLKSNQIQKAEEEELRKKELKRNQYKRRKHYIKKYKIPKKTFDKELHDLINEKDKDKIIKTILYNENLVYEGEKRYLNNYYYLSNLYTEDFKKKLNKIKVKPEDRLIMYGQNLKIKQLQNINSKIREEVNKYSFKPEINSNYEPIDTFYERNIKFLKNKNRKIQQIKIQDDKKIQKLCPFKPKINDYNIKRNIYDLFEWQIKVDKNKEYAKKKFEELNNGKINEILNYKPEYDYNRNKYLFNKNKIDFLNSDNYNKEENEDIWPTDLYQKL